MNQSSPRLFASPLLVLAAAVAALAGCAAVDVPTPPAPGPIATADGGLVGYQHGLKGTAFAIGAHARRVAENGYLKTQGDEGTVAVKASNGSAFSVPNVRAASLAKPPYGATPQDHDAYVRQYFTARGLPVDQVNGVQAMTLLEAGGRTDETTRTIPRVTAYYSVIGRGVGDVAVADSFAWARANADGDIVQEGVYWPALPAAVIDDLKRFKALLADPAQRRLFEARMPADALGATLVIRHSPATEDALEAFASLDVTLRKTPVSDPASQATRPVASSTRAAVVIRHFDITGTERFLPNERLDLSNRYPVVKEAPPNGPGG